MSEEKQKIPHTIGIIMDGNRRWAKARGLPSVEGHRRGYEKLRAVLAWAKEAGVKEMIVYAFSVENWNRTADEVGYLMGLFREVITSMIVEANKENTRLVFLGERAMLPADIQQEIARAEEETKGGTAFCFGIALSYGGRAEILDAIHRIPALHLASITEAEFSSLLFTREFHDPDLIIRTSGEERLSGFLPWQSVYSELHFTDTLWPDLTKEEFLDILREYSTRDIRRGK